ncbi:MAG: Cna B-type domain-containing protein [Acidimicrobiia bacterium]|nr:Cna B-type domain-containing protein [Acidimicrobiia bacterium]
MAGWTFTATSTGDGCTETAIATSGADGLATFTNLVSISPDGNPCQYTVTEVEHPGWTTTWTEATTGVLPDATTPPLLRVENKADAATTPGQITISKTVQPTGAAAITPGTSNPLLAGWVFSVQAADGQPADCTQGPVYGITTDTGQTTVTGLVDQSATTGRPTCVYTVTEISRPGYTATPASQDVAAGGNAAFTNTEVRTFTTLDVTKETFGPDGQPDNTALAGWSFVAASAQDGCTVTAVATTDASGQATFDNLVDIAPSGVECTYLVTEMGQSGWTQISASPGPVNPPAAVSFANQADPVSTFGFASVQKDARAADGSALPDRLAGWAMTAVSAQPGCTPSSVALTDATGLAVFSGLVDVTAAGTQCLYTITEIPAAGYQVSGSPVLSVDPTTTLRAPAAIITNTEIQTLGTLSVAKTVLDPFGQPVADASGWTFLATSAMSGCTTAAAGVTAADGSLVLGPLVDISSAGEQCTYTLIEVSTAGFVTTDVPITGTLTGLAQPVQVTNRADSVSVDGVITVQKTVLDPDGVEMPLALGDWVFVANGEIAGCTPAAFGMTDSTGLATLDVVETLANGTACTYTISEIGADGYLTDITPSTGVTAGSDRRSDEPRDCRTGRVGQHRQDRRR